MDDSKNYDVVTFTNISDTSFTGMFGGKERTFEPHSVTQLPRFLADHFAKHLAVKVLIAKGKEWGNDSKDLQDTVGMILGTIAVAPVQQEQPQPVAKEPEFADLKEEEAPEPKPGEGVGCPTCGKVYKTEAAMKAHVTRSHKV